MTITELVGTLRELGLDEDVDFMMTACVPDDEGQAESMEIEIDGVDRCIDGSVFVNFTPA